MITIYGCSTSSAAPLYGRRKASRTAEPPCRARGAGPRSDRGFRDYGVERGANRRAPSTARQRHALCCARIRDVAWKLLENWMPFARSYRGAVPRRCPVCDRRADTIEAAVRPSGVSARRLVLCAIHGVLEDAPVTSDLGIKLAGRSLSIHGALLQQQWTGGILLASADPRAQSTQCGRPPATGHLHRLRSYHSAGHRDRCAYRESSCGIQASRL